MLLVLVGGVMSANAVDDIYLRTDFKGDDKWNSDDAAYKFTFDKTNASNEDVYTYTINASDISTSDVWFRIHISGWGAQICPYTTNGSYTFHFSNGQNETYGAKYEKSYFQGDTYSFGISHSTIKASQYKITLFRGKNEVYYENENCRVMWIKVEIVSMPAKIGPWGYTTFSCNRALDLSSVSNAYYVAANPTTTSVKLVQASGTVQAGEGLVLYGEKDAGITIPVAESGTATALDGNLLVGCPTETVLNKETPNYSNIYVLVNTNTQAEFQNVKNWIDGEKTVTIPAGKAYLQALTTSAPSFSLEFDDETTGIANIERTISDNQYYTLDGRRVAQPTKGLYIVNGKKVIIK